MAEPRVELEKEIAYRREVEVALRRESKRRATAERTVRKQSQALAGTLNLLLQKPATTDFLRAILRANARECGGVWATLWQSKPGRGGARSVSFHLDRETEAAVEGFVQSHARDLASLGRWYQSVMEDHRCSVVFDADDRRASGAIRKFYQKLGVRSSLLTPLMIGGEICGWVSVLAKYPPNRLDPDKVAFVEATAQQAALAIYLRMLDDRARQLERTRSNERVARARDEELSKISQALWVPLTQVSGGDGIEMVLRTVTDNMADLAEATRAILWRRDENQEGFKPQVWRVDGKCVAVSPDEASALAAIVDHRFRRLAKSWMDARDFWIRPTTRPTVRRLLEEMKVPDAIAPGVFLVAVPLKFCDEALGFALLITRRRDWKDDERLLALRALAFRAALVLRVHELTAAQRAVALAEERSRIARDLHDLLAQSFAGISLQIEAVHRECPDMPTPVADRLEKIRHQAARSVDDMRRSLHMLRPALLDHQSLPDALVALAREMEASHGVPIKVILGRADADLDSRQEVNLYAIASEAMQNALKHASPRVIVVTLKRTRAQILLIVENDERISGRSDGSSPRDSHFGLQTMRERAAEIGGVFSFQPLRGGGARVRVSIAITG